MLFLAYNSVTRLTMYFMYQNFGFKFSIKKKEKKPDPPSSKDRDVSSERCAIDNTENVL